jgi:opacity protein-like surface antigen
MTKHALLSLPAAALASLAVAAPASADTLLAPDSDAQNVAFGGGYAAWATPQGDRFRLVVRAPDGTVSTPDLPSFARAPDPSIGSTGFPIAGRGLLLLYAREDAAGTSDIYAYDLRRGGAERKLPGLSSTRYDETAPSMAFGRFAVVRSGGRVNGVVTGTLGRPGVRRISKAIATETATNGSRVAYATRNGVVIKRLSGQGRALTISATGAHSLALTRYQAAWLTGGGRLQLTQRFAGSGGPYRLVVRDAPRQPTRITSFAAGASFNDAVFVDAQGVKQANPSLFR